MPISRRTRVAVRAAAAVLVAIWFLVPPTRNVVPFWLPFAILLAGEAEYLVRGLLEWRGVPAEPRRRSRGGPGPEDADLGWGEVIEEEQPDGSLGLRWVPPPSRPPRSRPGLVYLTGLVAAAALFVVAFRADTHATYANLPQTERAALERRVTQEAARIAGRPVTIRCDESYGFTGIGSDALGVAFPARALAYLEPDVCLALHEIVRAAPPAGRADAAEAVLVLSHEAVHLRGETREGVTECLGLQEGVPLAIRLGFDPPTARRMMRSLYERNLADRSITRLNYRLPASCVDAGALDERPDDPAFP